MRRTSVRKNLESYGVFVLKDLIYLEKPKRRMPAEAFRELERKAGEIVGKVHRDRLEALGFPSPPPPEESEKGGFSQREYHAQYYAKNRELLKAKERERYRRRKEEVVGRGKEYYEKVKDYQKAYYLMHKEEIRERKRLKRLNMRTRSS